MMISRSDRSNLSIWLWTIDKWIFFSFFTLLLLGIIFILTSSSTLEVKLNKENLEEYEILTKEDSMKVTYQLTQSRKLKSGELHYIDHPKFGIIYRLVKAEKIEQS